MPDLPDLGRALRAWRDRLEPATVGLAVNGPRRAPGLRREELALLAGVSIDYLTRLEQGRSTNPSPQVVAALARALQLDDDEQEHLYALAGQRPVGGTSILRLIPASVRRLVDQLDANPIAVFDAGWDLLSSNAMWAALLGDPSALPERHHNIAWNRFTQPSSRVVHADEDAFDAAIVADLRTAVGRYPDDARLQELVRDLFDASATFRRLWATESVGRHTQATKTVVHPELGALELDCDVLTSDRGDLRVVVYTAPPGSEAAARLQLLGVVGNQTMSRR